jgi:hypothetical protein
VSTTTDNSPDASSYRESSEDTILVVSSVSRRRPPPKSRSSPSFEVDSPAVELLSSPLTTLSSCVQANSENPDESPRKPTSRPSTESPPRNPSAAPTATSPPTLHDSRELGQSPPVPHDSPEPEQSPPTRRDSPELEQSTAASIDEANHAVVALTTFLDETSPFRPLGLSTKDLQEAGISTIAELKIVAHNPEVFRTKISVLTDLHARDKYLWMMFRKGLKKLLERDRREQSAGDPIHENDPITKFVCSLGGGEYINSEELVNGLRGAGISSETDLLVLSRNLEKYTENIPFLREFATSGKFSWMVFQVGLEGLQGQKVSTSIQTQDHGAGREGHAFVKWFLDTVDPDKPLGHLADSFIEEGLNDRIPLLHVAEDIEVAIDSIPFLQDLASGDQLIWAMIVVGLGELAKRA